MFIALFKVKLIGGLHLVNLNSENTVKYLSVWYYVNNVCMNVLQPNVSPLPRKTTVDAIGCPAKTYIQLKLFIFEKVWNKSKQIFTVAKYLSSFGNIYWLNILGHYMIVI